MHDVSVIVVAVLLLVLITTTCLTYFCNHARKENDVVCSKVEMDNNSNKLSIITLREIGYFKQISYL